MQEKRPHLSLGNSGKSRNRAGRRHPDRPLGRPLGLVPLPHSTSLRLQGRARRRAWPGWRYQALPMPRIMLTRPRKQRATQPPLAVRLPTLLRMPATPRIISAMALRKSWIAFRQGAAAAAVSLRRAQVSTRAPDRTEGLRIVLDSPGPVPRNTFPSDPRLLTESLRIFEARCLCYSLPIMGSRQTVDRDDSGRAS